MNKLQTLIALPAVAGAILLGGAVMGYAGLAAAQGTTGTTSASATAQTQPSGTFDPAKGGHVGKNGTKEEILTGDLASKATTAALAAVPGGTVERVETDAEGAAYEAHMTKADGSHVTVKFDQNFNVTATEDGPSHQ